MQVDMRLLVDVLVERASNWWLAVYVLRVGFAVKCIVTVWIDVPRVVQCVTHDSFTSTTNFITLRRVALHVKCDRVFVLHACTLCH